MKNPTKAEVQIVIDNFKAVLPLSKKTASRKKGNIDMTETEINFCGSPMCHAGWYVAGVYKNNRTPEPINERVSYIRGASLLSKHLGFMSEEYLLNWAKQNPKLWGNENGELMFNSKYAFNFRDKLTLAKIVNHWMGVQKRLPR